MLTALALTLLAQLPYSSGLPSAQGPIYSGPGSSTGEPENPGTLVFSLLAPGSTETTECACADLTAVTGQAVTWTRTGSKACEKADSTLVFCAANKPAVQVVDGNLAMLMEGSTINQAKQSSDLSVALNWTNTNVTCLKNATGPSGVANSVSTCTATGANATMLQATVQSSASHSLCARLKRITGTGGIDMTRDNGASWIDVTASINGSTFTRITPVLYSGLNTTSANPTVGFRIRTSGDAIAIGYVQEVAGNVCTSDIETTTAVVTRGTDSAVAANPLTPGNPINWCFAATGTPLEQPTGKAWTIAANGGLMSLGAYAAANTADIAIATNGRFVVNVSNSAVSIKTWNLNPPSPLPVGTHALAFANRVGGGTSYLDGVIVSPVISGTNGIITTQPATNFLGGFSAGSVWRGFASNFKIGNGPLVCH